MTVTVKSFQTVYPQFASVAKAVVQRSIDRAAARTDEATWGDFTDEAIELLTAHFLESTPGLVPGSTGGLLSGAPTSITVNERGYSVTSAASSSDRSDGLESYQATAYGRQYAALVRSVLITPLAT